MSKVGWGWMVALLVGLMAGCLVGCSTSASKADEADSTALSKAVDSSLLTITAQVVGQRSFNTQSTATGILRAPAQSKLNFRTGGTLTQIVIQNGASVKAGQLLAQLDERDGQMALRVAQDGLLDARTQRNALLAEYGHDNGDTAHVKPNALAFINYKSGYGRAQTALAKAQLDLSYTQLRAPFAGVVANLTAKPYNFITAFEPFCTLLSRAGMLVEFSVLESELPTVQMGSPVRVEVVALPGRTFGGHVTEINPLVNGQGLVLVRARLSGADSRLFEGMNARVRVAQSLGRQLVVPKSAVVERSGRKVVFTVETDADGVGRAKWHYVTILHENDTEVAISEGLKAGERVIVSGPLNLAHDAVVRELK